MTCFRCLLIIQRAVDLEVSDDVKLGRYFLLANKVFTYAVKAAFNRPKHRKTIILHDLSGTHKLQ